MGFFSKLTFWKHEEEKVPELPGFGGAEASTDLTSGLGKDTTGLGEPNIPETPAKPFEQDVNYQNITPAPGTPPPPPESHQAPQMPQQDIASKNMEIISSKMDYLKASLENINQRLANLEAIARGEEQKPKYKW